MQFNKKHILVLFVSICVLSLLYIFLRPKADKTISSDTASTKSFIINELLNKAKKPSSTLHPNHETAEAKSADNSISSKQENITKTESDEVSDECLQRVFDQANSLNFRAKILASFVDTPKIPKNVGISLLVMEGLHHAGILADARGSFAKDTPPDIKKALEIFEKLSEEEPTNSAPLVILGIIYEKQNRLSDLNIVLEKIKKTNAFNTHFLDLTTAIYKLIDTPDDFIETINITSVLPIINYQEVQKFLLAHKLITVAEQMIKSNYSSTPKIELTDYLIIEYSLGRGVLNKLGQKHNYPHWRDYSHQQLYSNNLNLVSMPKFIKNSCDIRSLEPMVEEIKKHMLLKKSDS